MARGSNRRKARRASRGVMRASLTAVLKLSVLALLLFYGGLAFSRHVEHNELYLVKSIRIEGLNRLDGRDVLLSAGVTNRTNILLMREGAVSRRVEALPAVRLCEVRRVFPGQVIIRIEERDPVATLLANNRAFVIDREGVVLEERTLGEPHVEPYITEVPGLGVLQPSQRIDLPPLLAAIEMLDAFRQSEVARNVTVSEVAARSPNDLRMYCDELPFEIRWGRGDYAPQARRLDILWAHNNGELSFREYCDLRFDNKIACR